MAHNKKLMARSGIEKGQVVWAKLGGYPWWPGIVRLTQVDETGDEGQNKDSGPGARRVTVKFIGENTQYCFTQRDTASHESCGLRGLPSGTLEDQEETLAAVH